MEALREFLLRVLGAAMVCGVLTRITRDSGCASGVRLLCGVFLTIVLVQPLCNLSFEQPLQWAEDLNALGAEIAAEGSREAEAQKEAIIKARLESYIINKAAEANADVTADVSLGAEGLPQTVTVTGSLSPAAKGKLKQILTKELGIPEVRQRWNG